MRVAQKTPTPRLTYKPRSAATACTVAFLISVMNKKQVHFTAENNQKIQMVLYESFFALSKSFDEQKMRRHLMELTSLIYKNHGVVLAIKDLGWRRMSAKTKRRALGTFWYARWLHLVFSGHPNAVKDVNNSLASSATIVRFTTEKICANKQSLFLERVGKNAKGFYSLPSQIIESLKQN